MVDYRPGRTQTTLDLGYGAPLALLMQTSLYNSPLTKSHCLFIQLDFWTTQITFHFYFIKHPKGGTMLLLQNSFVRKHFSSKTFLLKGWYQHFHCFLINLYSFLSVWILLFSARQKHYFYPRNALNKQVQRESIFVS